MRIQVSAAATFPAACCGRRGQTDAIQSSHTRRPKPSDRCALHTHPPPLCCLPLPFVCLSLLPLLLQLFG
jgi:hypothetical protein